ncbi:hypothetical protein [Ekhidna sp. To15]|uniref:hypothetical protein n=1 Tax=Ekhidna sp. To15 TaxID=3395267 RepID=UPI003F5232C9
MKKLLFITLIFCIFQYSYSQNLELEVGMYGNAYLMTDLRDLQEELNSPFQGSEQIESFPPFLAFDLAVRCFKVKDEMIGPWIMYQSTGARNYYEDATGYFATDMILQGFTGGISVSKNVINDRTFLTGNIGVVYNDLLIKQEISVFNDTESASGKYASVNAVFIFGLQYYIKQTNPKISIVGQVDGSYFGTNLKLKSNRASAPGEPQKVKIDWTGFKLGLRIGFDKKKNND